MAAVPANRVTDHKFLPQFATNCSLHYDGDAESSGSFVAIPTRFCVVRVASAALLMKHSDPAKEARTLTFFNEVGALEFAHHVRVFYYDAAQSDVASGKIFFPESIEELMRGSTLGIGEAQSDLGGIAFRFFVITSTLPSGAIWSSPVVLVARDEEIIHRFHTTINRVFPYRWSIPLFNDASDMFRTPTSAGAATTKKFTLLDIKLETSRWFCLDASRRIPHRLLRGRHHINVVAAGRGALALRIEPELLVGCEGLSFFTAGGGVKHAALTPGAAALIDLTGEPLHRARTTACLVFTLAGGADSPASACALDLKFNNTTALKPDDSSKEGDWELFERVNQDCPAMVKRLIESFHEWPVWIRERGILGDVVAVTGALDALDRAQLEELFLASNENGDTILHEVASQAQLDVLKLFVARMGPVFAKQRLNDQNRIGRTPLHRCVYDHTTQWLPTNNIRWRDTVSYLLSAGCDPHIRDAGGKTAQDLVGLKVLMHSIFNEHRERQQRERRQREERIRGIIAGNDDEAPQPAIPIAPVAPLGGGGADPGVGTAAAASDELDDFYGDDEEDPGDAAAAATPMEVHTEGAAHQRANHARADPPAPSRVSPPRGHVSDDAPPEPMDTSETATAFFRPLTR